MMRIFLFFILFLQTNISPAQIKLCSWNLLDFGQTKSDDEIEFIANIIKDFDVVAIQEVVAKDPGGAQAVARLNEALNRKGAKWNYTISLITSSSAYKAERYAFLWKTAKLTKKGEAWLEKSYHLEIDREPFYCTFSNSGKQFTVVNFHAITKSRQPETEIKYFKFLPAQYPDHHLIFAGDFNLPQSHSVFNPLKKMGYQPVFQSQKSTLRQQCINNDCLASAFDNIFVNSASFTVLNSGVVHFYQLFPNLQEAHKISDHVPVWVEIALN